MYHIRHLGCVSSENNLYMHQVKTDLCQLEVKELDVCLVKRALMCV